MNHVQEFDLIVLGSGPSGGTVASKIAKQGRRVALIESCQFGGTCALRGCNPKKVYTNAGNLIDQLRRAHGQLVTGQGVIIDWESLHRFKNEFTESVPKHSRNSFESDGIAIYHATPRFIDAETIKVGDEVLRGQRFCLATGARPTPLDVPGQQYITLSDEFLDRRSMPQRVVFIGGGYISLEFAHVIARFGAQAMVVEQHARVLQGFDPDLVNLLTNYSEKCGIKFHCGRSLKSIDQAPALQVTLDDQSTIDCDLVVHGAGRTANLDGLDLDAADIAFDQKGVRVNSFLQSISNPRVYATGDCAHTQMPRLTPVANEEARAVVKNLLDDSPSFEPDYGVVPSVVFTSPGLARVGKSESDAKQSHEDLNVRWEDTSDWSNVRKTGRTVAGYKVLIDKASDQIVGAHLLGPGAAETINLFALAMKHRVPAKAIKSTLFAFPTFASDVRKML